MRIDDGVRKTIAFIGAVGQGGFIAHGTAFIVAQFIDGHPFQALVTARHVIDGIKDFAVLARLNTREGKATLWATRRDHWFSHPDPQVDVAVCPARIPPGMFDILHLTLADDEILTQQVIADREIGVGDEVAISGLYVARMGEEVNIPVVRIGTIAAMAEEKIATKYGNHDAYLIEVRSIDGLSGSPVFVQLPPWRIVQDRMQMQHGRMNYFMGMVLGHDNVRNPIDALQILQTSARAEDASEKVEIALNTGIAIVLPVADVKAALAQPAVRDLAEKIIAFDRAVAAESDTATKT